MIGGTVADIYYNTLQLSDAFRTRIKIGRRSLNTYGSLTKQPTFSLRNKSRKSMLMVHHHSDLGIASDWTKQISHAGRTNQEPYSDLGSDTSSVYNGCACSPDATSGVSFYLRLTLC